MSSSAAVQHEGVVQIFRQEANGHEVKSKSQ